MAEPIREQILEAARTRLETLTITAGYRQDVVRVLRTELFPSEVNEFPVLLVRASNEESRKQYDELDGGVIEAWMGIDVVGIAEGTDATLLGTVLERLMADVEIALTTDLHLGLGSDVVVDVRDLGTWESYPLNDPRGLRGVAITTYLVRYQYERGAP